MTKISRVLKHLVMLAVCALFFFIGAITARGATYYVAPTGNDSNPGTSDRPWRNPQQCVDTDSPLVAGDTCLVRNGIYTSTTTGRVVLAGPSAPAGQPGKPITIKAENPGGAHIKIPNAWPGLDCNISHCPFSGFYITRPYYVIEGFEITRPGSFWAELVAVHGMDFLSGATGGVARRNYLHDIGRTVCFTGPYAIDGVAVNERDVTIEYNVMHTIGRLRNGENGCSTTLFQGDHGIYASGTTNLTIRRNVFYDINRGYPIHIFKSGGGTTTALNIYHNTFSGGSPTGKPWGHILLANTVNGANIKNNISSDASTGMINAWSLTAFNVIVSHNLIDEDGGISVTGMTFSNNFERSTNLGFVNKSLNDFHLTPGSAAINRGTTVGVPPVKDGAPDIGAYELSEQDGNAPPLAPLGLSIQ